MTKDFNEDDLPSAIEELCLKHDGKLIKLYVSLLVMFIE